MQYVQVLYNYNSFFLYLHPWYISYILAQTLPIAVTLGLPQLHLFSSHPLLEQVLLVSTVSPISLARPVSRSLTMDFIYFYFLSFILFFFAFYFLFSILEQLGLGVISHAVTSVTT